MISYGFKKTPATGIEAAEQAVRESLAANGFGVLTRIDLREKFREKLGVAFHKYIILGACSPPDAHAAVRAEEDIGLMLPCNVVLYESDGGTTVSVIRPTAAMSMIENDKLSAIAGEVEGKLKKVFDSL